MACGARVHCLAGFVCIGHQWPLRLCASRTSLQADRMQSSLGTSEMTTSFGKTKRWKPWNMDFWMTLRFRSRINHACTQPIGGRPSYALERNVLVKQNPMGITRKLK